MKKLYAFAAFGAAALFILAWFKNRLSYGLKSIQWRLGKSAIDTGLVILAALYMPPLLIAWAVVFFTRNITRKSIQITLSVILGIVFSAVSGIALEILCVIGICSVDLLTGSQGILGWFSNPIPKNFMPGWSFTAVPDVSDLDKNHTTTDAFIRA